MSSRIKKAKPDTSAQAADGHRNPGESILRPVLGLPRLARIILCAVFALFVTFALFPLVDAIYLRFFFSPQTTLVASLVSAGFGLAMYMLGWWLVVGTAGEIPQARLLTIWYLAIGVAAILVVIVLVLNGITILNLAMS